ncbi:hypothetical protein COV17_03785 [Candidatus Woesearchaeota archaeon CG10_big_fil_rev_8_21_14_0_10_36_11]|nr:MAG: hypothetical protein COV17_03785 [Candidatus Woesearchaeota archaeon CG10_big_fil_rev_8_21_14_0_10_36_11]
MEDKHIAKIILDLHKTGWSDSTPAGVEKVSSLDELCTDTTFLVRMDTSDAVYRVGVFTVQELEKNDTYITIIKGAYVEFELRAHEDSCGVNIIARYSLPLCCGSVRHYFVRQDHIDTGTVHRIIE